MKTVNDLLKEIDRDKEIDKLIKGFLETGDPKLLKAIIGIKTEIYEGLQPAMKSCRDHDRCL